MTNNEGYQRDKQILEDLKDSMPLIEYIEKLYTLYRDYSRIVHVTLLLGDGHEHKVIQLHVQNAT